MRRSQNADASKHARRMAGGLAPPFIDRLIFQLLAQRLPVGDPERVNFDCHGLKTFYWVVRVGQLKIFSLPIHPYLKNEDIARVVDVIASAVSSGVKAAAN